MKRIAVLLPAAILLLATSASLAQVSPVGSEFQINTYTTGLQRNPEVDMNPFGQFVAAWRARDQDGNGDGVVGQRYNANGNEIGGEFVVNTTTNSDQRIPDVKVHDDGSFVVVWESRLQDADGSTGIFGQRYDSSGASVGMEFQVPTYTTGNQDAVSVDGTGAGDFVVVWRSNGEDGDGFGVFGRRFASNGAAQGSAFAVNSYTTGQQNVSAVSVDAAGNFVVVFPGRTEVGMYFYTTVVGQRFDSGGTKVGGEFQVNTYSTGNKGGMRVDHDADGNFVVVWQSPNQDGSSNGIYARRYASNGSAVGGELLVNSYTTGAQEAPDLSVQEDGSFLVVYVRDDANGDDGVFSQHLDSSGAMLGGELQVSTYTTNNQARARLGTTGDGEFVVAWQSYLGQDGDSTGSFGQRLALPTSPNLTVKEIVAPAAADPGEMIAVENTVANIGTGEAGSFVVAIRLSANDICSSLDTLLGTRNVAALADGADDGAVTMVTIPGGATAGPMTLCVVADDDEEVVESDENDNAAGVSIAIDAIFADGFESGNTSAWSDVVP